MKNYLPQLGILLICIVFFIQFFQKGLLPIPSDTIVGLYHPFRDTYAKEYPRGVPYKNFLITDPVRQQYPWRELAVTMLKQGELPIWNPYAFAGYPLLANIQTAAFYPLNVLFFIFAFPIGWAVLIFLQPLLAGIFFYYYLRHIETSRIGALFGATSWILSGFFIAWLEWGTILHVILWLPLILLCIEKMTTQMRPFIWQALFVLSLCASFFAGHWQTFFYVLLVSFLYGVVMKGKMLTKKILLHRLLLPGVIVVITTAVQWVPSLTFLHESARNLDQVDKWTEEGWFIPWQHLAQFLAPDYFGNPSTQNYWGVWNYGELVGYIGILPLLFAIHKLLNVKDKMTYFWGGVLVGSFLFALPTGVSAIPYLFSIPFLSSSQPTRLLGIIDFSFALLAAKGLDLFIKEKRGIWKSGVIVSLAMVILVLVSVSMSRGGDDPVKWAVTLKNLVLPVGMLVAGLVGIIGFQLIKRSLILPLFIILIFSLSTFDLLRFGWKFTPFTEQEYLYPESSTLTYLQQQERPFRIMATDSRILPPNFSAMYRLESIDGYDPLYTKTYATFIKVIERNRPDAAPPFGFNRIITPQDYRSPFIDLLGVTYVLSLTDITDPTLQKLKQEGETRLYKNTQAFPRAFFVREILPSSDESDALKKIFEIKDRLSRVAVIDMRGDKAGELSQGKVEVISYNENRLVLKTRNAGDGYLVVTNNYYPTWKVTLDGKKQPYFQTDYAFMGLFVPRGEHIIEVKM